MKHVESHTCIRFTESKEGYKDYLQFIRGSGCYSSVGRVGGRQHISIGYGCDSVNPFFSIIIFKGWYYIARNFTRSWIMA